jgi:hypothetical protein
MEPEYDRHEAEDDIVWRDLLFRPTRFEVWRGGQKIKAGKTTSVVTIELEENGLGYKDLGQMAVRHSEMALLDFLTHDTWFDMYGAQGNRIVLLTIPSVTNAGCIGMRTMQQRWPHSRYKHNFESTEPFVCSLFMVNGQLTKVTFSLDNPETLVELYTN